MKNRITQVSEDEYEVDPIAYNSGFWLTVGKASIRIQVEDDNIRGGVTVKVFPLDREDDEPVAECYAPSGDLPGQVVCESCGGSHCRAKRGQVRKLPEGNDNISYFCRACYDHAIEWRREENENNPVARPFHYPLPNWEELEIVK